MFHLFHIILRSFTGRGFFFGSVCLCVVGCFCLSCFCCVLVCCVFPVKILHSIRVSILSNFQLLTDNVSHSIGNAGKRNARQQFSSSISMKDLSGEVAEIVILQIKVCTSSSHAQLYDPCTARQHQIPLLTTSAICCLSKRGGKHAGDSFSLYAAL